MKKRVILLLFILSFIGTFLSNSLSSDPLTWLGSPQVYPKPTDLTPSSSIPFLPVLMPLLAFELILLGLVYLSPLKNHKLFKNIALKISFQKASQVGLGLMFLFSSYPKILSPYNFAELVAQYQMLPSWSVNLFSLWLPAFELVLALFILFSPWVKEVSACILFLMFLFIIALGQALYRDLGVTCGCFDVVGAQDKKGAWTSFIRDLILLWPIIWLSLKAQNLWIWSFKTKPTP